jgi:low temperature requirement protein LtrA
LPRARSASCAGAAHAHARVTNIELFFDLVFVFAVTQLSHTLLAHLGVRTAVETTLLFLAVWWVWIYTPGAPTGSTPNTPWRACSSSR